jgi:hypothetical protein
MKLYTDTQFSNNHELLCTITHLKTPIECLNKKEKEMIKGCFGSLVRLKHWNSRH